jgi:hypothetical protein
MKISKDKDGKIKVIMSKTEWNDIGKKQKWHTSKLFAQETKEIKK